MIRLLPFKPNEIQTKYYFLNENSIHEFKYIDNADGVFINIEDVLEIIDIGSSLTEEAKDVNKLKYDYSFPLKGYINIKNIKLNSYSYQAVPHFVVLCEFLLLLLKDVGGYFYDEEIRGLNILTQSEMIKKDLGALNEK